MHLKMTEQLNESIDMITEFFDKYKDEPYMIQKIHQYICGRLPRIFDSFKNTYDLNQIQEEEKQNNQDAFIQTFLNNNTYLYHSQTSTFYYYNHIHYEQYSEDNILHHVLSTISKNRELSSWKKSTKIQIMCRIKQNALLKSIPNSETIQQVLELLKPLFSSKTESKYFLTVLGDTVLKKNSGLFYFIKPKAKTFLRELDNLTIKTLNLHCITLFKTKYYEHEYSNCRFIPISDSIANECIWKTFIKNINIIDMICVASHYSIRYETADRFIEKINTDQTILNYSFFIKDRSPLLIVQQFIQEYIQVLPDQGVQSSSFHTINWKNMFYLWKHFLDNHKVPTIIFQQNLKQILIGELSENYDIGTEQFHKVYSTFIPTIQQFLEFWNETIYSDSENQEIETYEIEEIVSLYKRWNPHSNLQEGTCLDLITYFFSGIEILENKYVGGIQCSLWIKSEDIKKVIESFMIDYVGEKTTIYKMYEYYCRIKRSTMENPLIVSKQYFEKYIENHIEEYMDLFFIGDS